MVKTKIRKSIEEIEHRWVENSMRAYLEGKKNLLDHYHKKVKHQR